MHRDIEGLGCRLYERKQDPCVDYCPSKMAQSGSTLVWGRA